MGQWPVPPDRKTGKQGSEPQENSHLRTAGVGTSSLTDSDPVAVDHNTPLRGP